MTTTGKEKDLEDQGSNETTPLMPKAPAKKEKGFVEKWIKWWNRDVTAAFKMACSQALRVAIFTSLIAAVPLSFPRGRQILAGYGVNVAKLVCTFLLVVGPTVGSSVNKGIATLSGNLVAVAHILVLFAAFPNGGHLDSNPVGFWVGTVGSMLLIVLLLWLNVPGQFQLFALKGIVFYTMKFLSPATYEDAYALESSSPLNSFIVCSGGVTLAVLCPLLPLPVTALAKTRDAVKAISQDMSKLLTCTVQYYAGEASTMEINMIQGTMRMIEHKISHVSMGDSWFECLGFGASGRSWIYSTKLLGLYSELLDRWDPLIEATREEEFDELHARIMSPEIKETLRDMMKDFGDVIDTVTIAAADGTFDEREMAEIKEKTTRMRQNILELSRQWNSKRHEESDDAIIDGLEGESIFFQTVCMSCRRLAECAEEMESLGLKRSSVQGTAQGVWQASFGSCFDRKVLFSSDHNHWVARAGTSIILTFWIGFFGWSPGCSTSQNARCFLYPHDPSTSLIVVVLLSKFVGSALRKSLDRLIAMVIANFVAFAGHVFFGWCNLQGRILTGVVVFFLVLPAKYVSFIGGSYALIGTRMAAIGAGGLLLPCSDVFLSDAIYASSYNKIISALTGVAIMLLVDCFLGDQPPSLTLKSKVYNAMDTYTELLTKYLQGAIKSADFCSQVDNIRKSLVAAQALVPEAVLEPRLWRPAWRMRLNQEVLNGFIHLCHMSSNLGHAVEGNMRGGVFQILESCPAFYQVRTELLEDLEFTVHMARFVMSKKPGKPMPEIFLRAKKHSRRVVERTAIKDLVKELNDKVREKRKLDESKGLSVHHTASGEEKTAENRLSTLTSVIVANLKSMFHVLRLTRSAVVNNKIPL